MNEQLPPTFFTWETILDSESLSIEQHPENIRRKAYLLSEGAPCKDWFPDHPVYTIAEDSGLNPTDFVHNNVLVPIVSETIKSVLETATEKVEFLPINVVDRRNTPLVKQYYIFNVLDIISCADMTKSDFEMSALDKGQVDHFRHLHLDPSKTPRDLKIFRLSEKTGLILIREDLRDALEQSKATGIAFGKLEDYGKKFRQFDETEFLSRLFD